ncbi:hypothetical protein J437_LFUL002814 [Ladona fulva]|uniref:Uncharacterized protein n=1 Tax=Ladona fulva TaxID=123851 RepID=A0A8K0K4F6_LADFU|nr:hypothetical protein J437_LFUL002814 [Ladona fulva]
MMALPRVPINPCLNFGEPLENVCAAGLLHPGLKELFSKAYFSAHPSESLFYNEEISEKLYDESSSAAWIVTILKFGQGTVSVRLALKERLETGRWLLPLQVPPAAPLWLIRHFLGRLPTPLIFCSEIAEVDLEKWRRKWLRLSADCRIASYKLACRQKLHHPLQKRIASSLGDMKNEACLILFSLITLIRNLSYEFGSGWINSEAVRALVEFFTPAIMSRPYRPGYLTKDDRGLIALLEYLCCHFPEVKALCRVPNYGSRVKFSVEVPKHPSSENQETKSTTPPALKKILMEDLTQVFSKASSQNIQPQLKSKVQPFCGQPPANETEKTSAKEETQAIYQVSEPSNQTNHDEQTPVQKLEDYPAKVNEVSCNMKEDGQSCLQKEITLCSPEKVSSNIEEEQKFPEANQHSSCKNENEQIFCNSTIRKCQALKLAYKLRVQCLAWRLAGLFIDGVTSPISGIGYSKLTHDFIS